MKEIRFLLFYDLIHSKILFQIWMNTVQEVTVSF